MPLRASFRECAFVRCPAAVLILSLALAAGIPALAAPREVRYLGGAHAPPAEAGEFLRALIYADKFYDLRWPNITDVRGDLGKLYAQSRYAAVWLHDGQPTPQARQMIELLLHADSEGLKAEDYDASLWPDRLEKLQRPDSLFDGVRFDVALSVCALRYVAALSSGRVHPQYLKFDREADPKGLDLPTFIYRRLATGSDVPAQLSDLEPPFTGYRQLRKALATYERLAREDDGAELPMPKDLGYPGPPYAGYPRLVRLLRLLGDLPADYAMSEGDSRPYDPDLLRGVEHFQQRHGLPPSGYLNAQTIAQLNVPLRDRVEQIRLALERYRWARFDFRPPLVLVNVAAYRLYAFNADGKIALSMKVDVGDDDAGTRTPLMEDTIDYLVFRPSWGVPLDIQKSEVVPEIAKDPQYLAKFHFEVITPSGKLVTAAAVTPQVIQGLRTGHLRLRQRPGPDNAMGLLKFVFPNRYNVYLHDIPARQFYFSLPQRVISHGCVHVEHPAELAAWMLNDNRRWTVPQVERTMQYGKNDQIVRLSKPMPVLFVYSTVTASADGSVNFYPDIYGYDAGLQRLLARGYPYPR